MKLAYLIPDNLRSRKDVPEAIRRVASALSSGLDEDVTVWFEPLFDPGGGRPHFVVLDPRIGVIVLQVLSIDEGRTLLGSVRGKLRVDAAGTEIDVENPMARATEFARSLQQRFTRSSDLAQVAVGAVAVLPTVSRAEAEGMDLALALGLERCLFKADLDEALLEGNGSPLIRAFRRATAGEDRGELTSVAIDAARAAIHPEIVIKAAATQGALFTSVEEGGIIKVMDRKQEAFAKSLGTGHRVIRGVAGSGKTLVLVHRARLLARLLPSRRILLTCYTRSLASSLRAQVSAHDNIDVVHLDKLMSQTIASAGLKHPGYDGDGPSVESVALEAVKLSRAVPKYRAVMIDEAQDFDTDALKFCVQLLDASDDPAAQDLIPRGFRARRRAGGAASRMPRRRRARASCP